jgi:hypothetical protein
MQQAFICLLLEFYGLFVCAGLGTRVHKADLMNARSRKVVGYAA